MKLPASNLVLAVTSSILCSCAVAPGLHMGKAAPVDGTVDTTAWVNGLRVELKRLTPASAREAAHAARVKIALPRSLVEFKADTYKIGLYDVVTVAVWEHPELSMPLGQYRTDDAVGQTVDEEGQIFYPYAGPVDAAGLTTGQLRQRLTESLSRVLNNPQLDVKVTAFRSQKVYVQGAVMKPGAVAVRDVPLTVLDAIDQSGGLAPIGNAGNVRLTRDGETWILDLYGDYQGPGPSQILLRDGDAIHVPSREEDKVYVLGEVIHPAALALENGKMSLVRALAEVGGLAPLSAKGRGIYVIRNSDSSRVQVFHLQASDPLALAVGDAFPLKPHDMVYVDATGLARWNRVIELIVPTTQLYYNTMLATEKTQELGK